MIGRAAPSSVESAWTDDRIVELITERLKWLMECAQVGEVGELSEIFQWRGDAVARGLAGFSSEDRRHVGEEMSDVSLLWANP